jgi:hypothetical protein
MRIAGAPNRLGFHEVVPLFSTGKPQVPHRVVMADYREIAELQKDPASARAMAQLLSALDDVEWTDWEFDFLASIGSRREDLTTRQGEKLLELRDESVWYTAVDGFSLKALVDRCYLCRDELDDRDTTFIERHKAAGSARLRRKDARRLLRCARALSEIEPYHGYSLDRAEAQP